MRTHYQASNSFQHKIDFPEDYQPELKKIDWEKYWQEKQKEKELEEKMIQETLTRENWEKELQEEADKKKIEEAREELYKNEEGVSDASEEYRRYGRIKAEEEKKKKAKDDLTIKPYSRTWWRYVTK